MAFDRSLVSKRLSGYDLRVEEDDSVRKIISERDSVLRGLNQRLAEEKRRIASEAGIVFPDRPSLERAVSELMGEPYEVAGLSEKGAIPLISTATLASYMSALKAYGSELAGPPTEEAVWAYKCGSDNEAGCGHVLGSPLKVSNGIFYGKNSNLRTSWNCRVCERNLEGFREF